MDAFMVSFVIGSINNGILAKVLKRLLNQDRPENMCVNIKNRPDDKGMPSSHGMSLGFIYIFSALAVPQLFIPFGFYCFISLYYRIEMNLHTKEQIIVGFV